MRGVEYTVRFFSSDSDGDEGRWTSVPVLRRDMSEHESDFYYEHMRRCLISTHLDISDYESIMCFVVDDYEDAW